MTDAATAVNEISFVAPLLRDGARTDGALESFVSKMCDFREALRREIGALSERQLLIEEVILRLGPVIEDAERTINRQVPPSNAEPIRSAAAPRPTGDGALSEIV